METVLISGVDGFTGRYLAPLLASAGYRVHGLVQSPPVVAVEGVDDLHVADLSDAPGVARAVRASAPTKVVHLAGISFVAGDAEPMYRVNLLGTRHLLEALSVLTSPVRSVLLASSANVYGNATEGQLDESTPPVPANDYAVSKLAMEYLARLYASRLPLIICRPFNYTGVGQAESFLLPKIVAHVRRGAQEIELGNLDVARDFSDVREVSRIYEELLANESAIGKTINVCSGRAYTLDQVLNIVMRLSGRPLTVTINPALVRRNEVKRLWGSRQLLDSLLTSGSPPTLEETLNWMLGA